MSKHHAAVHVIINPAAGHGKGRRIAGKALSGLRDRGLYAQEYVTEGRGHATSIAAGLPDDGLPLMVLGGDGTLNEVINGLKALSHPITVLAAGTGNDFARLLGYRKLGRALDALTSGLTRRIDIAEVEVIDEDGGVLRRRFINSMGVGFDAAVAVRVAGSTRGTGMLPYLIAVARELRRYRSVNATIVHNNREIVSSLFLACIGNGTSSGGGFRLTPAACPDDGMLNLCHVRDVGVLRVLRVLPLALKGLHIDEPEVTVAEAKHFRISLDLPLSVHLDGEIMSKHARTLIVRVLPACFDFSLAPH